MLSAKDSSQRLKIYLTLDLLVDTQARKQRSKKLSHEQLQSLFVLQFQFDGQDEGGSSEGAGADGVGDLESAGETERGDVVPGGAGAQELLC